jgi:hypothetical protein
MVRPRSRIGICGTLKTSVICGFESHRGHCKMENRLKQIVQQVQEAISNEGPRPDYHRIIVGRHRRQFPTLWVALDELLAHLNTTQLNGTNPDAA